MLARLIALAGACAFFAGCGEVFVAGGGGGGSGGGGSAQTGSTTSQGGSTGTATSTGSGPSCAAPAADDCQSCLYDQCGDEFCACAKEDDCPQIFSCVKAGNPLELCLQMNKNGISVAGSLQACGYEPCPACAFNPVEECLACQFANCPEETNNCLSVGDCGAFFNCVADCRMMGNSLSFCSGECAGQYPDVTGLAQALVSCTDSLCSQKCVF